MVKALGSDIKNFWSNGFPENHYYEGEYEDCIEIEDESGKWLLNDTEKYELKNLGWIIPEDEESEGISFEKAFKAWYVKQKTTTLTIEVNKDELDKVLAEFKRLGLKVKK